MSILFNNCIFQSCSSEDKESVLALVEPLNKD